LAGKRKGRGKMSGERGKKNCVKEIKGARGREDVVEPV